MLKNLPANAGDIRVMGSIPESGRFPWRKKWLPTLVFLLEKFHGQRSLVGYSPWDCKELNVIEHMHTHTHTQSYIWTAPIR